VVATAETPRDLCEASICTTPRPHAVRRPWPERGEDSMTDDFEYVSHARLQFRDGYRQAFLGEVAEPVTYGVQGKLREYYGAKEGPPIASTLDHIVAAVAG